MVTQQQLNEVIDSQRKRLMNLQTGMERSLQVKQVLTTHAIIISGIRRCGKSTLLRQLIQKEQSKWLFLNFEDPRLSEFDIVDFERLGNYASANGTEHFYLDEIQNIDKWENFVRFKLDEGYKVTLTGSNASLLSKELGTKLTGRHLTLELFPFDYAEYLRFTEQLNDSVSLKKYMLCGGFPEYVKSGNEEVLVTVFNDILLRDIAVRYQLKQVQLLRSMAVFLLSNSGNRISANALRKQFQIASTSTVNEYLSYLTDSYLFQSIQKFSYSLKVQQANPKKWYAIDTGMITVNSRNFTPDFGRLLETLVFLQLRRKFTEIYYFSDRKECDFVVFKNSKLVQCVQVCYELNTDNLQREIDGLTEALDFFQSEKGLIISFNQEDIFHNSNKKIEVVSYGTWLENGFMSLN